MPANRETFSLLAIACFAIGRRVQAQSTIACVVALFDADVDYDNRLNFAEYWNLLVSLSADPTCPDITKVGSSLTDSAYINKFNDLVCICLEYPAGRDDPLCCDKSIFSKTMRLPVATYPSEYTTRICLGLEQVLQQDCGIDLPWQLPVIPTQTPVNVPSLSPSKVVDGTMPPSAFPSGAPLSIPENVFLSPSLAPSARIEGEIASSITAPTAVPTSLTAEAPQPKLQLPTTPSVAPTSSPSLRKVDIPRIVTDNGNNDDQSDMLLFIVIPIIVVGFVLYAALMRRRYRFAHITAGSQRRLSRAESKQLGSGSLFTGGLFSHGKMFPEDCLETSRHPGTSHQYLMDLTETETGDTDGADDPMQTLTFGYATPFAQLHIVDKDDSKVTMSDWDDDDAEVPSTSSENSITRPVLPFRNVDAVPGSSAERMSHLLNALELGSSSNTRAPISRTSSLPARLEANEGERQPFPIEISFEDEGSDDDKADMRVGSQGLSIKSTGGIAISGSWEERPKGAKKQKNKKQKKSKKSPAPLKNEDTTMSLDHFLGADAGSQLSSSAGGSGWSDHSDSSVSDKEVDDYVDPSKAELVVDVDRWALVRSFSSPADIV
jgi:hypothetical protein